MRKPTLFHRLPLLLTAFALAIAPPLRAEDHAALGSAALGLGDYPAAVEHLEAASRDLEGGDREKLSQVQIDLGVAYLTGLAKPADALRAFVRAADLAANPATAWIWASTAARELGDSQESERYRRLALGKRVAPPKPASPEPAAAPVPVAAEPAVAAEKVEAPLAASKDKDLKDSKDGKDGKDEKAKPEAAPPAKPEAAPEPTPAGSAFDHFFKSKPADEPQAPPASEPPPAGASGRL